MVRKVRKGILSPFQGLKVGGGIGFRGLTPPGQNLSAFRACLGTGLRRKDMIHKWGRLCYIYNRIDGDGRDFDNGGCRNRE
jgi:hypothetical protein